MFVMTTPVDRRRTERHHRADRQVDAAVMMTNVTPSARTPLTEVASRMPTMLLDCRKFGEASEKNDDEDDERPEREEALDGVGPRTTGQRAGVVTALGVVMQAVRARWRRAGWRGA